MVFKVHKPIWAKVEPGRYNVSVGSRAIAEVKRVKEGRVTIWKLVLLIDAPYMTDISGNARDAFVSLDEARAGFETCYGMRESA